MFYTTDADLAAHVARYDESAEHIQHIVADLDANVPDWESRLVEASNPERFVPSNDFDAATPQDWADLQMVLDWEALDY